MPRRPQHITMRGKTFVYSRRVKGRRIRKVLGTDRAEAIRLARQWDQKPAQGWIPEPRSETVEDFAGRWVEEWVESRRNEKGQKLTEQRLRHYILPAIGQLRIREVSPADLRGVLVAARQSHRRRSRPLSAQTVRHLMSDVRCLFGYALKARLIDRSPFEKDLMPQAPETVPDRLTGTQVTQILEAADRCPRYALATRLGLLTGLRWGELHGLTWRHVKLEGDPHLELDRTKSGKVRRVPLSPEAVSLLRAEKARTSSISVLGIRGKNPCSFVRAIGRRAGVRWHFHQLRHTFACCWLESGGSIAALQLILGHSTVRMTERYGRVSDAAVFSEAARIGLGTGHICGHISRKGAEVIGNSGR